MFQIFFKQRNTVLYYGCENKILVLLIKDPFLHIHTAADQHCISHRHERALDFFAGCAE